MQSFKDCPECKGLQNNVERNKTDIVKLFELSSENSEKINKLLVKIAWIVALISGISQGITIAVIFIKP